MKERIIDRVAKYTLRILSGVDAEVVDYGYGVRYSFVVLRIDGRNYIGVSHTLYYNLRGKKPYMDKIDPLSVVEYISSIDPYLKQIGHCIINAINQYLLDKGFFAEETRYDLDPVDIIDFRGKNIVFIGDVRPIVDKALSEARETLVFETDPCRRDLAYPEFYYYRVLDRADVVFITGSTLTNDSIDDIIEYIVPEKQLVVLIGPSASIPLEPLKDTAISMIASMHIPVDRVEDVKKGVIRGGGTRWIRANSRKYIQFVGGFENA